MAASRCFSSAMTVLFVLVAMPGFSTGLWCFHCSTFQGTFRGECPVQSSDPNEWRKNRNKYYDLTGDDEDLACALVYEDFDGGRIFHQTGVDVSRCSNEAYISTMIVSLNVAQGTNGALSCCRNDGCNWNVTTTLQDLDFAAFANATSDGSDGTADPIDIDPVPFILIGIVLVTILFCVFCFCCIWCANKRKEKEEEARKLYYNGANNRDFSGVNNAYGGRWGLSGGPGRNFDRASEKSMRGTRRIDVAGAPGGATVIDPRDHERYSAIDKRLYRRQTPRSTSNYSLSPRVTGRRPHLSPRSRSRSAESVNDPYDSHNKNRISRVSRNVFDNDDFRAAHYKETSDRQKQPRKYEKMKDWQTDYTGNANKEGLARDSETNAFRYGSA